MKPDIQRIERIKGFLDPEEGVRLFDVALEACRLGPCLEIGSYCGKSSIYLGSACKAGNTVLFSVDHHRGSEEQQPGEEYFDPELFDKSTYQIDSLPLFRTTISQFNLEDTVVPLVCRSETAAQAWATPLGLVFIDGGHAFETALTDYQSWAAHIMPQGYLLIHDIFQNPKDGGQAPWRVYQIAKDSGQFLALPMTKTLGVLQRLS